MRDHFLLDPAVVFLNHGSFGACPREVLGQQQQWQAAMERNPVDFLGRRSGALLADTRAALARYLNADAADLAFVSNATTGVNIVARSLQLQPGDEVLATDHEYGACDATWQQVCAAAGAQYRRVAIPLPFEPADFVGRVMAAVGPATRLIFASHITSTTALTFPVAALCAQARAAGVATLIDGAHAPGQIALDLAQIGADHYAGNCHKWMCAPKGAGFLHVQPAHQAGLQPPVTSWGAVADGIGGHTGFDAYTGSSALERTLQWQGTRDLSAFLAVPAAIDWQARHGWPQWQARCHALACQTLHRVLARNGLEPIASDEAFGQMVAIPVRAPDAEALRRVLFDKHRIEVPVTQHGGHRFVRLSVQAYNRQADMDALVDALAQEGV